MEILIHDKRGYKEFNTLTFSNYKKNEVLKALILSINKSDIETALYWSVELICSGKLKDLWDCILLIMSKHIHLGNPKLPIYISLRFNKFKEIIQNGYVENELELRNSQAMRDLFAEIIGIICFSLKKPCFELIQINKKEDFTMSLLGDKLKADTMEWSQMVFKKEDPNEILVAINEFAYHLNKKHLLRCCYWCEWLMELDAQCRKDKKPIHIDKRDFPIVEDKYQSDPIWLIWEILLKLSKNNNINNKIIQALLELFCIKYNFAQKKKRRYILYFAIEIYTEPFDNTIAIIANNDKINNIKKQINKVYRAIKQNEQQPTIISDKQVNLNKTLEKMKLLYDN